MPFFKVVAAISVGFGVMTFNNLNNIASALVDVEADISHLKANVSSPKEDFSNLRKEITFLLENAVSKADFQPVREDVEL